LIKHMYILLYKMTEKIESNNNLRYKLIKNILPNHLGKRSSIEDIINIIKETTSLTFKPIGYAKSLHFESKNDTADDNSRIGWCMYNIEDANSDGDIAERKATGDSKAAPHARWSCAEGDSKESQSVRSCAEGDSKESQSVRSCAAGDSKESQSVRSCAAGDSKESQSVRSCAAGDIIIYEEVISFDDNKIYNTDKYLDLTVPIEEPRYWFWRIIHNRYNNTYTLKRIELGVECNIIKINVPLKVILKLLYERIKKYESYRLK